MPTHTRTSVPDQITLLMKCILDDEVRRDAIRGDPDTLEDAYHAILSAVANRAHNRTMNPQKPHHPKPHHPKPPRYQQPRTSHSQVPSNPPTAPAMGSQSMPPAAPPTVPPTAPLAPVPYLGKLTQEERQRCIQQGLCFRCREPRHSAATQGMAATFFRNMLLSISLPVCVCLAY
jgi:hypothetical protein